MFKSHGTYIELNSDDELFVIPAKQQRSTPNEHAEQPSAYCLPASVLIRTGGGNSEALSRI